MDSLKSIDLPNSPGVYKFLNSENKILYVGKSKNLKNRVKSYFQKDKNKKIANMIKETTKIDFVLSETEHDALLLENNLIKENKPKYNILLRDDKSFPYIVISKERFPKIYSTRKVNHKKEEVFGPYTNVKSMRSILKLIKNLYKIRNCNYVLSSENIDNEKFKVCLEYHLGNCKGPCENKQDEEEYVNDINEIRNILKGKTIELTKSLKEEMINYSKDQNYEKAQEIKDKIFHIESFTSKSVVVNFKVNNLNVFGLMDDDNHYFINFMKVNNGMIIGSETLKIRKKLSFDYNEIGQILIDLKLKYGSISNDTISNISLKNSLPKNLISVVPRAGDKKSLIDMSLKNVLFYKKNLYNEKKERKTKKMSVLIDLKNKLNLKSVPFYIECFDISNIQGSNTVASMVLFRDGYPSKKEYRRFKIRSVDKPDDFKSMREVVERRYSRLIKEEKKLPDLIIIDGGKGQLSASCQVLKNLKIYNKINIIGIAKKLEEIYFPNDSVPILLGKKSEQLKLIQNIRNEAHRFAINYHKQLRSNTFLKSELEQIDGIGEKTRIKLIKKFKSFDNIKKLNKDKLVKVIGEKRTYSLLRYLEINTPKG
ncbi:MAG: excinuclease ABC subunit UvrC [Flammeovirgaceae bacterium]